MRATVLLIGLGLAVELTGCATASPSEFRLRDEPSCEVTDRNFERRLRQTRREVEQWMSTVPYRPDDGRAGALIESYPGRHPAQNKAKKRRSYLYDQALGLLWYGWAGHEAHAARLADALVRLQREDGSWGFSVTMVREDGQRRYHSSGRVRNGAVAWAVHALEYHGRVNDDRSATRAARRGARYLLDERIHPGEGVFGGLIRGGRDPRADSEDQPRPATADPRNDAPVMVEMPVAITEHQLDAHMALRRLEPEAASRLRRTILDTLWIDEQGRFAVAARRENVDDRRALDAAGAWGALWLEAVGARRRADRSLQYTVGEFDAGAGGLRGFRPYLDAIDGYDPSRPDSHIFTEGTLGVGLAAGRLEKRELSRRVLKTAVELHCLGGPGLPYSNRNLRNFPTAPAAAPSLWFLFLERESRTGERAPIFSDLETS